MKRECWAASLGDCSDKITGEHIITEGVFPKGEVWVQGLRWCPDHPKSVGLASLTANILCSKHNSGLSLADTVAIQTVKAFRNALDLTEFRQRYKKTNWTRRQFKIDGYRLKSWFLKTLINVAYKGHLPIGSDSSEPGRASSSLVETAFGRRRFAEPMGVYAVAKKGDENPTDGRVRILTLSTISGHIGGAIFQFGGLKYLLYLEKGGRPSPQSFVGPLRQVIESSQFMYRLRQTKFSVHDRLSHTIDFQW
jgi:hypothetical protein